MRVREHSIPALGQDLPTIPPLPFRRGEGWGEGAGVPSWQEPLQLVWVRCQRTGWRKEETASSPQPSPPEEERESRARPSSSAHMPPRLGLWLSSRRLLLLEWTPNLAGLAEA